MSPRIVGLVYRKELIETLRDRRTLIIMVLLPLVLYPLVVLTLGQGAAAQRLDQQEKTSRIGFTGPRWERMERALAEVERVEIARPSTVDHLRAGKVDLLVQVPDAFSKELKRDGTVSLSLRFLRNSDRSMEALRRAREALLKLTNKLRDERLTSKGLPLTLAEPMKLEEQDLATSKAMGAKILAGALPLMVVLMVLLGAFYPAIDLTAGEKERGTLETLLVSPVRRTDIITGKFLVVATIALATGVLNLGSMGLSFYLGFRTFLVTADINLDLPWNHLGLTVLALVPASIFYAAVMLAVASLARSFKEAQNLLTPVYMVFMMPSMLAMLPWVKLTPVSAMVPAVNIALLTREIITGNLEILPLVICLLSSLLYTAAALKLAARIYSSERLLFAPEPLSRRLRAKRKKSGRTVPEPGEAAVVLLLVMGLILFVGQRLQISDIVSGLLVTEWVLIALPVVVLMRLGRFDARKALGLINPGTRTMLGAGLAGISGWVLVGVLVEHVQQRVMPIPEEFLKEMQRLLFSQERHILLDLFLLAVTPAICEELLFRGLLLRATRGALGFGGAILLNGVLFGVFHLSIHRFMPTLLLGLVLAYIALRSGSLLPGILFHFLNNGFAVVVGRLAGDATGATPPGMVSVPVVLTAAVIFVAGIMLVNRGSPGPEAGSQPPKPARAGPADPPE